MKQGLSLIISLVYWVLGQDISVTSARAQVSPDGTTPTNINQVDNVFEITGGAKADSNLFHSFQEFSVPTNGAAFFENQADIVNIFSRVTGGSISNIDGLIKANGGANLFLLNPAGIIFGEGAKLEIGGSFLGSTADSIVFPEGEFSATDLDNPPLITINAPIGLQFRETSARITNRSRTVVDESLPGREVDPLIAGLKVEPGNTLALVGGDLIFQGGNLTANGGRIELGSVSANSFVNITSTNQGLILGYGETQNFQDISLFPRTIVDTSSDTGGGAIQVQGQRINFTSDDIDSPVLLFSDTASKGQGGNILVSASESISMSGDFAGISTQTDGMGSAGNIRIETRRLTMEDGSFIGSFASLNNIGSAGDVTINALESLKLTGVNSSGFLPTVISSDGDGGDGGNLRINTKQLVLENGAQISTTTFGKGQAGDMEIISNSIVLSGLSQSSISEPQISGIFVSTQLGSTGDAGQLNISTKNFTIENGARISALAQGTGAAGQLNINAENINLDSGSLVATTEVGAGGNISLIVTDNLILRNNSLISAEAKNVANGGNISIAADFILGFPSTGLGSDIRANAKQGIGGNINILTRGVLGFEVSQGTVGLSNDTNDIDASSEANLDGNVTISSPDTNPLQGVDRLPTKPVSAETVAANSCSAREGSASLVVKGKGGIVPVPTSLLTADALIPDGKPITRDSATEMDFLYKEEIEYNQENSGYIPENIEPIHTDNGAIYPARGIIKTADGKIILTGYPNRENANRTPEKQFSCN